MFLFNSGLSRFTRRGSFKCDLNLLFSFKRIVKFSKLASWSFRKVWPKIWGSLLAFHLKVSYPGVPTL